MLTPEKIDTLKKNEIFICDSIYSGRHGTDAAYLAWYKFSAEMGIGKALTGQCYALPTMDEFLRTIPLNELKGKIANFIKKIEENPEKIFLIKKLGCGIAGYIPKEIAPLLKDFMLSPTNLILPCEFHKILYE